MYKKLTVRNKNVLMTSFLFVLTFFLCNVAFSEEKPFPTKPIEIVVPYSAGGATDMVARCGRHSY